MVKSPKVTIYYCAKCKWQNRAIWYLQEVLQTFSDPESHFVAEVSLCPVYDQPGLFEVDVTKDGESTIIYKRKMKKSTEPQAESYYYDGFPDSKLLKILIRNNLFPESNLGHVDGHSADTQGLMLNCKPCQENS